LLILSCIVHWRWMADLTYIKVIKNSVSLQYVANSCHDGKGSWVTLRI